MTILRFWQVRDDRSRCYASIAVPQKGVDPEEYATRRCLRFLEFLGYQKLLLKTDQESALKNVMASVKAHRGADTQNMEESSPAHDSTSNGFIERAIQTLEGQNTDPENSSRISLGPEKIPLDLQIFPVVDRTRGHSLETSLNYMLMGVPLINAFVERKCILPSLNLGNAFTSCHSTSTRTAKWPNRTIDGVYLGVNLLTSESCVRNQRWDLQDAITTPEAH